jgi:molybdenum cofactor guanylyltransferase
VIAGGRSTRFGTDKAAALLDGEPLLSHARAAIAPWCAELVVCGEGRDLPDLPRPGLGPLGGIAAALTHARARGYLAVLTVGCDMPRVPPALVEALLRRPPAFCPDAPVLGCWPATLAGPLSAVLDAGDRGPAVRAWAQAVGALPIAAEVPLANVNTPADLARL